MIKAYELRIGNKLIKGGVIVTIDGRSIFDIWSGSNDYNPIPLTPEILVKFLFGTDKAGDYIFQDLRLRLWKDNAWVLLNANGYDLYPGMPLIKYLHQLQNIIFYLTGKELNIKL